MSWQATRCSFCVAFDGQFIRLIGNRVHLPLEVS